MAEPLSLSCPYVPYLARLLVLLPLLALPLPAQPARLPPDIIELAVETPAPRWKFVDPRRYREMRETFALQVTAVAAHQDPTQVVQGRPLADHLAAKLRSFLVTRELDPDGTSREPEAQGGIGGWTHNAAAQSLLLARRTPEVWSQLSAVEKAHADLLMQALAVAAHFCLDDDNDYYLLLDGHSLFHKSWNPNHVEGYVGVIIAASLYFGADTLNAFFESFEVTRFLERLQKANFQNIYRCWTYRPEMLDLLERGGVIAVPDDAILAQGIRTTGAGVRNSFSYEGMTLDQPWLLHRSQALRLFSRAVRTYVHSHPEFTSALLSPAHPGELSPWEGQPGMGLEFESTDWTGHRTSLIYAYEGAMIDLCTAATLKVLGEWPDGADGNLVERRMAIGMADLRFKAERGYRGWANGRMHETTWEKDLLPYGADFIYALWESFFRPPPPPPAHR
jgi:hypothetical protein